VNGIHDMGGMQGFGPVPREENEPVFHADWEKVILTVSRLRGALGLWALDEQRHGTERMDPRAYLTSSYYERWLASDELLLVEKGILTPEEIEERVAYYLAHPDEEVPRKENPELADRVVGSLYARAGFKREATSPPRFAVGDRVVTRRDQPLGHTRLPRYARGRVGVIDRVHGTYVFPDSIVAGEGENPQPLYSVRFEARELWGDSAEPGGGVYIDLWESYLAPA
jgi:nitrile hydratase beta subunit